VGYTNDEKSTLLEQLPMANILAEDRLFAFQELHEIRALPTTPIGKECRFSSGDTFTINHKELIQTVTPSKWLAAEYESGGVLL
nr:hypothetical protein [Tanacetum cinerariifolium]